MSILSQKHAEEVVAGIVAIAKFERFVSAALARVETADSLCFDPSHPKSGNFKFLILVYRLSREPFKTQPEPRGIHWLVKRFRQACLQVDGAPILVKLRMPGKAV